MLKQSWDSGEEFYKKLHTAVSHHAVVDYFSIAALLHCILFLIARVSNCATVKHLHWFRIESVSLQTPTYCREYSINTITLK